MSSLNVISKPKKVSSSSEYSNSTSNDNTDKIY